MTYFVTKTFKYLYSTVCQDFDLGGFDKSDKKDEVLKIERLPSDLLENKDFDDERLH